MRPRPFLLLPTLVYGLASCRHPQNAKVINSQISVTKKAAKTADTIPVNDHLYLKNDSIYIVTGKKTYRIANDTTIDYKHPIDCIYEVKGDSVKKYYSLVWNRFVLFTTYVDVGMGYRGSLYVYDTRSKKLINERAFKCNYLFSSAAVFVIDKKANKIFTVARSMYCINKDYFITTASMYGIKDNSFKLYKNVYEKGEETRDPATIDTAVVSIYHRSLSNNAIHGKTLPRDLCD